jgi:hypothetical protein
MSDLVPAEQIEQIVGVKRHRQVHFGRAVSDERTVYILHSQRCLDTGIDLRDCRFSVALDSGIDEARWGGWADCPVVLGVWHERLVPLQGVTP